MALHLFADASATAKRYVTEVGTETVNAVFALDPQWAVTYATYAEVANITRRALNRGTITAAEFASTRTRLEDELLNGPKVELLSLADAVFLGSIALADAYNLNSTDAALLYVLTEYARLVAPDVVLLCSDLRFIRAAESVGVRCFNPESVAAHEAVAFFAA